MAGAGTLTPADLVEDRTQIAASLADIAQAYPKALTAAGCRSTASKRRRCAGACWGRPAEDRVIGLAWQPTGSALGGLEPFAPLLDVPGIRWVALPMGAMTPALSQLLSAPGCLCCLNRPGCAMGWIGCRNAGSDRSIDLERGSGGDVGRRGRQAGVEDGRRQCSLVLGVEGEASKWHPTARIIRAAQAPNADADI